MFDSRSDLTWTLALDPVRQDCTRRTTGKGRETAMRRTCRAGLPTAVLTLLVLVGALAVHGRPAAASDRSEVSATALPAAGTNAVLNAPYLSLG